MINKNEFGLTIPCHWNETTLNQIAGMNQGAKTPVTEIYGALANDGPVKHGRSPDAVISVNRETAKRFKESCEKNGIEFTYLLNAPFNFTGDNELTKQVDAYLDWIVNGFRAKAVTISSHELMKYVRAKYPDLQIHVSTIAGVRTRADMEKYLDVQPNRVVPHHDLGKNWSDLEEMVELGRQNGVDIEILATESCLFSCPTRDAHYKSLAQSSKDAPFHTICNTRKLNHPSELLMAGGVIRPEDIHIFEQMGVSRIKISGRSKPAEWLPEVVNAYQTHGYRGNLIRLLGVDPSLRMEEWMFLDNKALEGFLESFPQNDLPAARRYCEETIIRLYEQGAYRLNDGTIYREENGKLILAQAGDKTAAVINKENVR